MICPHDDDPATCPPCRRATGRDPVLTQPRPEIAFEFTARYDGDCTGCHLPIHPGQACAQLDNGQNVHRSCTP